MLGSPYLRVLGSGLDNMVTGALRTLPRVPLLGIGILFAAGCSTTLNDYRCTLDSECVEGQEEGLCHSTGFCTFLDVEGCDGYRFGKRSGENSNLCVGDIPDVDASMAQWADAATGAADASAVIADAAIVDAGPIDAAVDGPLQPPSAVIGNIILACDLTTFTADGNASQAFGDASLTSFTWSLEAPGGALIDTLVGAPGSGFIPTQTFLSGTLAQPRLNLTPYQDANTLFVDTDEGHSRIRQDNLSIGSGNHTFSFAIGTPFGADVGEPVDVELRSTNVGQLISQDLTLTTSMQRYSVDFSVAVALNDVSIRIHSDSARYYLDNFRIHEDSVAGSSQAPLVSNPSLEEGIVPWGLGVQIAPGASFSQEAIPGPLTSHGEYRLRLVVEDSEGLTSDEVFKDINHQACP